MKNKDIYAALNKVIRLSEELDLQPYLWHSQRGVPIVSFRNHNVPLNTNVCFFWSTKTFRVFSGRPQTKRDFKSAEEVSEHILYLAVVA